MGLPPPREREMLGCAGDVDGDSDVMDGYACVLRSWGSEEFLPEPVPDRRVGVGKMTILDKRSIFLAYIYINLFHLGKWTKFTRTYTS